MIWAHSWGYLGGSFVCVSGGLQAAFAGIGQHDVKYERMEKGVTAGKWVRNC